MSLNKQNVGEVISSILKAKIKIWVLTGDKKQTAIEIGKSCNLLPKNNNSSALVDLATSHLGESKEDFRELVTMYYFQVVDDFERDCQYNMIIDGANLVYLLENEKLKKLFFAISSKCDSVVCCRVSPKQKSLLVRLVKDYHSGVTLAIGDGSNDVPMILEANVGVGISGKEGTQAARSADYSIHQFRFLQKLLFVHGKYGYRRISFFIYYYFYKNMILVFAEVFYAFYTGFSGQLFFTDILPVFYNIIFTSWPSILSYCLEKDVDEDLSLKYPVLYQAGHRKIYFNLFQFWKWTFLSFLHGSVIYFLIVYTTEDAYGRDGKTKDMWFVSSICFTCVILIVNYKIYIDILFWNKLVMSFFKQIHLSRQHFALFYNTSPLF